MSPIARAIRLTDPVCRPSAAAISDTTRRRASQASRFRSACVHSFGLDDFISIWSNDLDATDIGKSTGSGEIKARRGAPNEDKIEFTAVGAVAAPLPPAGCPGTR